jgi:glycine C-acetyltransferase
MSSAFDRELEEVLQAQRDAGTFKRFRVLDAPQAPRTRLASGADVIVASSNDYLGLAADPAVVQAGIEGLRRYGAGTASVRFISGTFTAHLELEQNLAEWVGTEASTTYVSCWNANAAVITSIATPDTVIFSDQLNHASIVDACRAARARAKVVYPHSDLATLDARLGEYGDAARKVVVTDGVFSMEGDLAPLPGLLDVVRRHGAVLVLDDSHGLGVMGAAGRGTAEHFGLVGEVDIITGTLGKALGGAAGGFVAGSRPLCELLDQTARPGLFSNALPPTVACSANAALQRLRTDPGLVGRLHSVAERLRAGLREHGLEPLPSQSGIVALLVGETERAIAVSERLEREFGLLVTGFGYPVVPEGTARIRLQASAAMDDATVEQVVDAVASAVRDAGPPAG